MLVRVHSYPHPHPQPSPSPSTLTLNPHPAPNQVETELHRFRLPMAADVELWSALTRAVQQATRKGGRILVVDDLSCGLLPVLLGRAGHEVDARPLTPTLILTPTLT